MSNEINVGDFVKYLGDTKGSLIRGYPYKVTKVCETQLEVIANGCKDVVMLKKNAELIKPNQGKPTLSQQLRGLSGDMALAEEELRKAKELFYETRQLFESTAKTYMLDKGISKEDLTALIYIAKN